MTPIATDLPEVLLFEGRRFEDERGFLAEAWNGAALSEAGLPVAFVQDNFTWSERPGTIRGLHFQDSPHGQGKLTRVLRGAAYVVAVDIRHGSASFGRHAAAVLSAANWCQLWCPPGFAHGLMTLEAETEVLWKMTAHQSPNHARGLSWNDPDLGIEWPLPAERAIVSAKDRAQPRLRDLAPWL